MKDQTARIMKRACMVVLVICLFAGMLSEANATENRETIPAEIYAFEKKSEYPISAPDASTDPDAQAYGTLSIQGTLQKNGIHNGVNSYLVQDDMLHFYYNHDDSLLAAPDSQWHLYKDNGKMVDGIKIPDKIGKGVLLIRTSIDRKNWVDVYCKTNFFDQTDEADMPIYQATDIQLLNGCYYRVIVAYETRIATDSQGLPLVKFDDYDYKKQAEVYEFYAISEETSLAKEPDNTQRYTLGDKVRVEDSASYSGTEEMKADDPHYGWDLGSFFISGYTNHPEEKDGRHVFLKNVGDQVALWFHLDQNLDALNGNENLTIGTDKEGRDLYFETPTINFGRGTLIVQFTDSENMKHAPVIYSDYLSANTSLNANTRVQLFEEGDYEVALDYEILENKLMDQSHHYQIFFAFSVRNSNSMFYVFDLDTGAELSAHSIAPNGFRLDLAGSKYLDLAVSKKILTEGVDGLQDDVRFNRAAKDGDTFTEEGIYTIKVTNRYTGEVTEKTIYVGDNQILKAYMTTGYSIGEIRNLVNMGAVIDDSGRIELPESEKTEIETVELKDPLVEEEESAEEVITEEKPVPPETTQEPELEGPEQHRLWMVVGILVVVLVLVVVIWKQRVSRKKKEDKEA